MIEHRPWVGKKFCSGGGIKGQKIAIVGYSHYLDGRKDNEDVTKCTISRVIRRDHESFLSFFYSIERYFDDVDDLWEKVLFFNFIPNAIGNVDRRFALGKPAQIEQGRLRVTQILKEYLPDKVIVLTRKGWSEFPKTCEEVDGGDCPSLDDLHFPSFTRGSYRYGASLVRAFGLRHPLYADVQVMRNAITHILALPFDPPGAP